MKNAFQIALLVVFVLGAGVTPVRSQGSGDVPDVENSGRITSDFVETLENQKPIITGPEAPSPPDGAGGDVLPGSELMPPLIDPAYLNEAGIASMQTALKAFYDYNTNGFDHRSRVFEWQLVSSRLIFALVIAIVGIGLYFSWLQFIAGMRDKDGPDQTSTTLEASPTGGIKVSSPVLGVIILTLSLVFFYLYLVHVYPIEEIF